MACVVLSSRSGIISVALTWANCIEPRSSGPPHRPGGARPPATIIAHGGTNGKRSPPRNRVPAPNNRSVPAFRLDPKYPSGAGRRSAYFFDTLVTLLLKAFIILEQPLARRKSGHGSVMIIGPSRRPITEEVGFEPTVGLHLHRFSRPALSTTQAPLL